MPDRPFFAAGNTTSSRRRPAAALGSPAVLPVGRGMKAMRVLTEGEKIRRHELVCDSKSALEQGLTL
jgi:hypothetical protein